VAKNGFFLTLDTLTPNLGKMTDEVDKAIRAILERYAPMAEARMKQGARWTDRTGAARMGLGAKMQSSRDEYAIVLYHTVEYGIWLEVRWSGRYAIIEPTIESMGPEVMAGLDRMLGRMF